ncbi:MAG TPA: PHP domain-containing protein [Anaerolineaceae bacterium]|nr:PHP domain-containing protein [Anaerolineaceae bacterium]
MQTLTPTSGDLYMPTAHPTHVIPTQGTNEPGLTPTMPAVMIGNLHMHTDCSDGLFSYEEMVHTALNVGFNFIAVTDHSVSGVYSGCNSQTDCSESCATLVEKCRNETRLLCFPGTEITGRVHLLAIGIAPGVLETLSVAEQVAQIHALGGLAIAAHPFNSYWPYGDDELFNSDLDAMECIPGVRPSLAEQQGLSAEYGLPCVYTSDAHDTNYLRVRYMSCSQPFVDVSGLKAALDAGACIIVTPTPKPKDE